MLPTLLIGVGVLVGVTTGTVSVLLIDRDDSGLRNDETYVTQSTNGNTEQELANQFTAIAGSINNVQELVALLKSAKNVERLRVLYNFTNVASVKNLETFLEQSADLEPKHLRVDIQRALVQGLATHNPKQALGLFGNMSGSLSPSLIGLVFQEWAVADLDRAVAEAADLINPNKRHAVEGILTARYDLSERDRRELARRLGDEQIAIDQIALGMVAEEILDPKTAWKRFIDTFGKTSPYSTVQQRAIVEIAQAWIAKEGNETLNAINEVMRKREDHVLLIGQILENIAKDNPHSALEMANTIDLRNLNVLSRLVSSAADINPRTAFDAASAVTKPQTREHLQKLAISAWVEATPLEVLDAIDQIPSGLREWSRGEALTALARESPETAASLFSTIDNIVMRNNLATAIVREWAKQDHEGALRWVNSNPDFSNSKQNLHIQILRSLAQEDIQLAITVALDQPLHSASKIGLEAAVITEVASFNVDEAISLLNYSRTKETRHQANKAIGSALVVKGRSELALELEADSSPEVQYEYFAHFADTWAYNDPEDLYEKLEHLPSEKISENLGVALARMHSIFRFLSPEQKEGIKKYVPAFVHGWLE
ncbi:MAG: hypothetical protein F4W92_08535 [Gammaproteobacteria bacterium]|nr:hypothetical protein [Gammaproteobacteria bacterium]